MQAAVLVDIIFLRKDWLSLIRLSFYCATQLCYCGVGSRNSVRLSVRHTRTL